MSIGFWTRVKNWLFGVDLIDVDTAIDIITSIDADENGYISIDEIVKGLRKWTMMIR